MHVTQKTAGTSANTSFSLHPGMCLSVMSWSPLSRLGSRAIHRHLALRSQHTISLVYVCSAPADAAYPHLTRSDIHHWDDSSQNSAPADVAYPDLATLTYIIVMVQVKMDKWTPEDVSKWLQTEFDISTQQARKFASEEINGRLLLKFSEKKLTDDPFCLTTGKAMMIMERIDEFKNVSGKVCCMLLLFALYQR